MSFIDNELVIHVQHAWSWCNIYQPLKMSLIHVATVFSADCEKGWFFCSQFNSKKKVLSELSWVFFKIKGIENSFEECLAQHEIVVLTCPVDRHYKVVCNFTLKVVSNHYTFSVKSIFMIRYLSMILRLGIKEKLFFPPTS